MIASFLLKMIVLAGAGAATPTPTPTPIAVDHSDPIVPPTAGGETPSACPSREAVATALAPALTHRQPGADPLPSDFRLVDLGAGFEVAGGGEIRRFVDAARDCTERARVAAVFVALLLNPPTLRAFGEPTASPTPGGGPQPPPRTGSSRWFALAIALRYEDAIGAGGGTIGGQAVGGEIRGAVGHRSLGLVAAAGALSPTESQLGSVSVRQQRFPCSLSVLVRLRIAGDLEIRGAGGVSLTPVTLRGPTLTTSIPATRLDAGARLALELWSGAFGARVAPFVSLHAEYFPRTYAIGVAPLGGIGSTAAFQLGLSAGIAFGSRLSRPSAQF